MPRLFTGLEIPPLVAQSLSMMRGGLPGARWIDPENYHLTLRFIGDIDDALAHEIAGVLEPEGRKYTPHVTLARLRDTSSWQVADYLGARGHYRSAPFQVSRFVLFSSRSSVGGGPYIVEADYPLAERALRSA